MFLGYYPWCRCILWPIPFVLMSFSRLGLTSCRSFWRGAIFSDYSRTPVRYCSVYSIRKLHFGGYENILCFIHLSKWEMVFLSNTEKKRNKQNKKQSTKKNTKANTQSPKEVLPHTLSAGKDVRNWVLEINLIDRIYANLHLLCKIMGTHIYNKRVICSN